MPSAYLLAKDQIEQARAILANEIWYDAEVDHLLELAAWRLQGLDHDIAGPATVERPEPTTPLGDPRIHLMPWLAR